MTPVQILMDVVQIAQMIYNQVQLIESNKKKWRALAETVRQVVTSLQGLRELPRQENFINNLTALQTCLQATVAMLKQMAKMGRAQRFFYAGQNQATIDGFKQSILDLIPLLNLGLTAQQLIDREQDRRNEMQDREELMRQQEAYLRQAQQKLNARDLEEVMRKQLASAMLRLEKNFRPAPVVEPPPLPEHFMIELHEVVFANKIATSSTGDVYLGTWQEQPVTIKLLEGVITQQERKQFIREAQMMSRLRNEHIVPFYGACFENQQLCIVLGHLENGTLLQVLSTLTVTERHAMAKDLAQGLVYLHAQSIVHGNIQAESVGVDRHNQAKWTDFGWSKTQTSVLASIGIAQQASLWHAPETWTQRAALSPASDMYSFGWLLWTLAASRAPYATLRPMEALNKIRNGERETVPTTCTAQVAALINACWSSDPAKRPTAADAGRRLHELSLMRPASPDGEAFYEQAVTAHKAKHMDEAYQAYLCSYEKGFYKSATSLGLFSLEGSAGQRVDKHKAQQYFEYAAERGHARAMYNLGRMHEKGDTSTATTDYSSAHFWYSKAFAQEPTSTEYDAKVKILSEKMRSTSLSPCNNRK